ncbi:GGDEF domain-containing protein [Cryptosporangium phraense]|uniref:GGDEF domain-containing protein n=1 Tax=Cryptosporangium phraense TaxID=2593070 RepID=A0A545AQC3_9ACTN|nr:GGDEF domain-containing protein [Cryptosporangium phraense]TQS43526.1 GGDEF domain-containing protein [Cryptosporangium phraense]
MRAPLLERRAVARLAVIGSVLGLMALAGLAFWGTSTTTRATSHVRVLNEYSDRWGQVFARINLEQDAAEDFVRTSNDETRAQLTSVVGSAGPALTWLQTHGDRVERESAGQVEVSYRGYTSVLKNLLAAEAYDVSIAELHVMANEADLNVSTLRDASSEGLERQRVQLAGYLDRVERRNDQTRVVSAIVFGLSLTLVALCGAVLFRYQRQVERQADDNRHASLHDALTGLANRVLFSERIERALAGAERRQELVGVLLLDLNRFKQVNDSLGHHVGDALLAEVAVRIGVTIRDADTAARLGGDEFGVLLPDVASAEEATDVAGRIKAAIEAPLTIEGAPVAVGASVGVAIFPTHGMAPTDLLRHADSAMYDAKRSGRGVVVHVPDYPGVIAINRVAKSP